VNEIDPQEFRLKSGPAIIRYIRSFSATEKAVFAMLTSVVIILALVMATKVNTFFLTDIPTQGGELREGEVGLPHTINPVLTVTDVDRDLSSLIYSGLMKYSNDNLVPDLASSYSLSTDNLTYTFNLRSGLVFQDGSPITADDIAFTVQKIQDPTLKSPRRADWADVTVKVLGPKQIQFILKQPYSPFLSNTTIGILPKHIWGGVSDDQFIFSEYNIEPIGSGPYRSSSIARDSGGIPTVYTLQSWGSYYGTLPLLSTISFHFFPDSDKALSALDQGSIDSFAAISPDEAERLASDSAQSYTVLHSPLPRVFGIFFNQTDNLALADKNVRQALNMTVDRSAIVAQVLHGYGSPIDGPFPTDASPTYSVGTSTIDAAQTLLEKNGWKKNLSTGIYEKKGLKNAIQPLSFDIYTADNPDLKQAADMVRASWVALGADVSVKVFAASDLYQNVIRPRKYDALLFGELIGKDRDIFAFWHSSQRIAPGLNVAMYANSNVDKLLENIRLTADPKLHANQYDLLSSLINIDVPAVFLYSPDFIYVVPRSLHGVKLDTVISPADRWSSVTHWYMATQRVWQIFAK